LTATGGQLVGSDAELGQVAPGLQGVQARWRQRRGDMLADLYLDFNDFDQIELLIFRDRLSAAVLIANSVKKSLNGLASKYDAMRVDGSYAVPGWETETSENFDEKVGIPGAAHQISIGATILTAVAALESLLIDLTPDSEPRVRGLRKLIQAFLDRYEVPNSQRLLLQRWAREWAGRGTRSLTR
jgi:hypothetical protein